MGVTTLRCVRLTIPTLQGYDGLNTVKECAHATCCYRFIHLASLGVFSGNAAASDCHFYTGAAYQDADYYADDRRYANASSDRNAHHYSNAALSARRNGPQWLPGRG